MPQSAPVHRPVGAISAADRRAAYDAARSATHGKIYGRHWRRLRAMYLAQHPLCECGCGHPAQVVHHRQDVRLRPDLIHAWDNLQALTKACHDRITATTTGFAMKAR